MILCLDLIAGKIKLHRYSKVRYELNISADL